VIVGHFTASPSAEPRVRQPGGVSVGAASLNATPARGSSTTPPHRRRSCDQGHRWKRTHGSGGELPAMVRSGRLRDYQNNTATRCILRFSAVSG